MGASPEVPLCVSQRVPPAITEQGESGVLHSGVRGFAGRFLPGLVGQSDRQRHAPSSCPLLAGNERECGRTSMRPTRDHILPAGSRVRGAHPSQLRSKILTQTHVESMGSGPHGLIVSSTSHPQLLWNPVDFVGAPPFCNSG
ncbi:hypothetical protein KIL84_008746 [Mauremys mutica]|uniref:Uncharacterized protein n=1 Tax=Mauremys mutica TaxID=74926 RepID=A0A9D3X938_9SAUR|nr:hypothetical protein KIL84_008746 [Mauremys mutica]